jgi:hypothetical protein
MYEEVDRQKVMEHHFDTMIYPMLNDILIKTRKM